jgi:hypothetical protein
MDQTTVSAFDHGTIRVGSSLATAAPLWIKPYKSIGVGLPTTGALDVYASFVGVTYFAFEFGLVIEEQFMKYWQVSIPAQWLKFVGRSTVDTEGLPDGTMLAWGGKS